MAAELKPIRVSEHAWYVLGDSGMASGANQGFNSNAGFVVTRDSVVVIDALGYTLVNGLVIAKDWASLTSGKLLNTITADENSQTQDTKPWTGTLADGQPALGSEFCGDWDAGLLPVIYGGAGRSLAADSG